MTGRAETLRLTIPMMRGDDVRAVQEALAQRELLPVRAVDGLFGPKTQAAIRAFQTPNGLPATGVVDAETRRALIGGADAGAGRRAGLQAVVKPADLPAARPERVILHWTAGGANASNLDRQHYHFLIQQDGQVVKGGFTIADNESTADGRYAAHTRRKNTRSVGIALCGMAGAYERPFRAGPAPITASQLDMMARLVAQICNRYAIKVTRQTVLAHGEVQEFLGVTQSGKWDPLVLPWRPQLSKREVGDHLRELVAAALTGVPANEDEEPRLLDLDFLGTAIAGDATASDGTFTVPLARLLDTLGWRLAQVEQEGVTLMAGERPILVQLEGADHPPSDAQIRAAHIAVEDLAEQLDLAVGVREDGLGVSLEAGPEAPPAAAGDQGRFRTITVARGDTLSSIARRELGRAEEWRRILRTDGRPFDEASARRLAAGQQVVVPVVAEAAPAGGRAAAIDADILKRIAEVVAADTFAENRETAREHVPRILAACLRRGVSDPAHLAYVLATAEHETNFGRQMIEKWGPSDLQRSYEGHPSNSKPGDGKRYLGRGFVQLTFRENYRKFARALNEPLEAKPKRAADPDVAAEILAQGMSRIGYRSPKFVLKRYGFGSGFDFDGAREIVNADRNTFTRRYDASIGVGVGRQARKYFWSLSLILEEASTA